MDWNILGIALLLTLSGLYFLETERNKALVLERPVKLLRPAQNAIERAWQTEPVQVFMRQLMAVRNRRSDLWLMDKGCR